MKKEAETEAEISEIISNRWSCRSFDSKKAIEKKQIESICEAARWAPSCFGDEPWRFIVWDKNTNPIDYEKAFSCIGEWNQKWIKNCPIIIGVFADSLFRKEMKENRWAQYDTGSAAENLCLEAVNQGLMAHQIGGFDPIKIKEVFLIPDRFVPMSIIGVGYQAEANEIDEPYRSSELADRKRRPLGTCFFDGRWENPIDL